MYSIRVEADFAAAHFLSHYQGKCERLHGHNYRVRVWARGKDLSEGGMLIDFGVLKEGLRTVLSHLDHRNLNDIAYFQDDPSAERIARYVFEELTALLKEQQLPYNLLWAVDVFETPTSMARYEGD